MIDRELLYCIDFYVQISHDYAKSPLMEGMDDSASLKDLNEMEDDEKSVKSCDDKNVKNVTAAVVFEEPESETKVVESSSKIGEDFDPKIDQLIEPAKFAPKDLLALLRNIEKEIHQVSPLVLNRFRNYGIDYKLIRDMCW